MWTISSGEIGNSLPLMARYNMTSLPDQYVPIQIMIRSFNVYRTCIATRIFPSKFGYNTLESIGSDVHRARANMATYSTSTVNTLSLLVLYWYTLRDERVYTWTYTCTCIVAACRGFYLYKWLFWLEYCTVLYLYPVLVLIVQVQYVTDDGWCSAYAFAFW
jgi:hypothetical protein